MPLNKQLGDTCQYFSMLHLMDTVGRYALSQQHMKDAIRLMATRVKKLGSGFIADYCSLVKDPAKISDLGADTYYADNNAHAIVMRKPARIVVWNPNLAEDREFDVAVSITSEGQKYPSDGGAFSLWRLKDNTLSPGDAALRNAERARQIGVLNALSTYLRTEKGRVYNLLNLADTAATYADELAAFTTAIALMNEEERKQLCVACAPAEYKLGSAMLRKLKTLLNLA